MPLGSKKQQNYKKIIQKFKKYTETRRIEVIKPKIEHKRISQINFCLKTKCGVLFWLILTQNLQK